MPQLTEDRYNEIQSQFNAGAFDDDPQKRNAAIALRRKRENGDLLFEGETPPEPQPTDILGGPPTSAQLRPEAAQFVANLPPTRREQVAEINRAVNQRYSELLSADMGVRFGADPAASARRGELRRQAEQEVYSQLPSDVPPPVNPGPAFVARVVNSALLGGPAAEEDMRELIALAGEDSPIASAVGDIVGYFVPGLGALKLGKMGYAALRGKQAAPQAKMLERTATGATAALGEAATYEATVGSTVRAAEEGRFPGVVERAQAVGEVFTDPIITPLTAATGGLAGIATQPVRPRRTTRYPEGMGPVDERIPERKPRTLEEGIDEISAADEIDQRVAGTIDRNVAVEQAEAIDIGMLFRRAISGDQSAMEALAAKVKANPEIAEIAADLEIDIPLEALTDNTQLLQALADLARATGINRSVYTDKITAANERANDLLTRQRTLTRISDVNATVRADIDSTRTQLQEAVNSAYDVAETIVPGRSAGQADNVIAELQRRATDLGSPDNLHPFEKQMWRTFIGPLNEPPGTSPPNVTLDLMKEWKSRINSASMDMFQGSDSALRRRYQGKLAADQVANFERLGGEAGRSAIETANRTFESLVAVQDSTKRLFGRLGSQDLAPQLRSAVSQAKAGSITNLARLLDDIPEDFRADALGAAIRELSGKGSDFSLVKFASIMDEIKTQEPVKNLVYKTLGPQAAEIYDQLSIIGLRIRNTERQMQRTGQLNLPALQVIREGQDQVIGAILKNPTLQTVVRTGALTSLGTEPATAFGLSQLSKLTKDIGKTSQEWQKAAAELLGDPMFQRYVDDIGRPLTDRQITENMLVNSEAFKRWWRVSTIPERISRLGDTNARLRERLPSTPEEWLVGLVTGSRAAPEAVETMQEQEREFQESQRASQ
jgi:hypothetical protein